MIDASFVEAITALESSKNAPVEIAGRTYTPRPLTLVDHDPRPEPLQVTTLTALVDFLQNAGKEIDPEGTMIHIESPTRVSIISRPKGDSMRRTVHMIAKANITDFCFSKPYDPESFIVALQTQFIDSGDRAEILRLVGNLKAEAVQNHADDGVSQTVTTKKGVALAGTMAVPNPVTLSPMRTFPEINQPASAFVFRVKDGGEGKAPLCAMFTADGHLWEIDAIQKIKDWLVTQKTSTTEGIGIPIIA